MEEKNIRKKCNFLCRTTLVLIFATRQPGGERELIVFRPPNSIASNKLLG